MSYNQDTRLGEGPYPSVEMPSVYSTAPADWAKYYDWITIIRLIDFNGISTHIGLFHTRG